MYFPVLSLHCKVIKVTETRLLFFCHLTNNGGYGDIYILLKDEGKKKCIPRVKGKTGQEILQLLKTLKMLIRSWRPTVSKQLCPTAQREQQLLLRDLSGCSTEDSRGLHPYSRGRVSIQHKDQIIPYEILPCR